MIAYVVGQDENAITSVNGRVKTGHAAAQNKATKIRPVRGDQRHGVRFPEMAGASAAGLVLPRAIM